MCSSAARTQGSAAQAETQGLRISGHLNSLLSLQVWATVATIAL